MFVSDISFAEAQVRSGPAAHLTCKSCGSCCLILSRARRLETSFCWTQLLYYSCTFSPPLSLSLSLTRSFSFHTQNTRRDPSGGGLCPATHSPAAVWTFAPGTACHVMRARSLYPRTGRWPTRRRGWSTLSSECLSSFLWFGVLSNRGTRLFISIFSFLPVIYCNWTSGSPTPHVRLCLESKRLFSRMPC